MKEFFKKKWKLLSIIAAAVVAVVVTVVLCVCLIPGGKSKLATPKNLKVTTELFLTWDKNDEAANGYTVKVNGTEYKIETNTNSYDLNGKLKVGENTLAVKANATEEKADSKYAEIKYTLTKTPFATPAAPTVNERTVSWTAVTGATNGYTLKIVDKDGATVKTIDVTTGTSYDLNEVLSELINKETYKISVMVKAAGDHTDSAYSATVDYTHNLTPTEAAAVFVTLVNKIGDVTLDSKNAIATAKELYKDIKDDEAAMAVDGVTPALATLKTKDNAYYGLLVGAVAVDNSWTANTFTTENEKAFNSAYDTAKAYYATLIDDTATDTHTAKKTAYDGIIASITTAVNGIKSEIPTYTEGSDLKVYYDKLVAVQSKIEGLADYAYNQMKDEADGVKDAIADVLKKPYKNVSDMVITGIVEGKVIIIYEAHNVENEAIDFTDETPVVTITVNGVEATVSTEPTNGRCIFTADWKASTETGKFLTVSYKVGTADIITETYTGVENDAVPDTYKFNNATLWFNNGGINKTDDKLEYTGDPAFIDVYLAKDINKDGGTLITGIPFIKGVPVKPGMTLSELRLYLAREYAKYLNKEYQVYFLLYGTTDGNANGERYSVIDNDRISDVYTLDLTAEDAKQPITTEVYDLGIWGGPDYTFSLISNNTGTIATWLEQFEGYNITADNATDYFEILIEAYQSTTPDFSIRVPFKNQGYSFAQLKKDWATQYFKANGVEGKTVNFTLSISIVLKDKVNNAENPLAKFFKASAPGTLNEKSLDGVNCRTITFNKSDVTLPTDIMFGIDGVPVLFFEKLNLADIVINNYATLQLYVSNSADGANATTFYIVYDKANDKMVINTTNSLENGCEFGKGGTSYWTGGVNDWFNRALGVNNFAIDGKGWYFSTEFIDNPEDDTYLYGGGKSEWKTFYVEKTPVELTPGNTAIPEGNQVSFAADFDTSDAVEFMQEGNGGNTKRGEILTKGIEYIVINFSINGGAEQTAYLIPDMIHPEADIQMYTNTGKTGIALNCGTVQNGWVKLHTAGDFVGFIDWAVEQYSLGISADAVTKVTIKTALYSTNKGDYVASDGKNFSEALTWEKTATGDGE